MPMSPRLLRPRSTVHPEAQSWATRVIANGGTFSGSTLSAVSKFCRDIDAAGIRDKFYRLNLFCGEQLQAALCPLYLSTSRIGSALGQPTDTNNNFVSGDYTERGSTGGMTRSSGGTKQISTAGFSPNAMPQIQTLHYGIGISTGLPTPNGFTTIACYSASYYSSWYAQSSGVSYVLCANSTDNSQNTLLPDNGRILASRLSATDMRTYQNGVQTALFAANAGTRISHGLEWTTPGSSPGAVRLHYYTIGDGLTGAQVSALDAALSSFLLVMGRT